MRRRRLWRRRRSSRSGSRNRATRARRKRDSSMPDTIQAALLGVVQGATEFLPVSSTAHLILARAFFGFDGDKFGLSFDVACHIGTLIAVLIYFRAEIGRMIGALPRLAGPQADDDARLIWLLVI